MRTPDKNTIDNVASAVFDNGRRGAPRPGCDCVQCFGYCLIDKDAAVRHVAEIKRNPKQFDPPKEFLYAYPNRD